MILRVQSMKKCCDFCNKECATIKKCGKCKVATYCGRSCQAAGWKQGHSHFCKIWWDKTFPLYKLPFGYKMRALDYFGEKDFDMAMDKNAKLCFEELIRCNIKTVNAMIFCTESLGKVYLNIGIVFRQNDGERHEISIVNMCLVDEGQEAIDNINRGTGTIGNAAKLAVLDGLQRFLFQLRYAGDEIEDSIELRTLTYGRGLMKVCEDKHFQTTVNKFSDDSCDSDQAPIIWLPDMEYAVENLASSVTNASLNAFHGY